MLFCYATFLLLRRTACAVLLSQQQKRQLPITLCASLPKENITIDKNLYNVYNSL